MKKETKKHPLPHDLNYQNLCVSNEDAQNIDRRAIVELSYPSIDLMEKAGLAAADQALKIIKKCKLEHTLVFCGKGNNGGDGYVLARILHDQNHAVHCICLSSRENIKGDAAISYDNMLNSACDILHIKKAEEIENLLQRPALWVDAIFGTGIHSDIEGLSLNVLNLLNQYKSDKTILAIDIPSGIDGNNGLIRGPILPAHLTVTMGFYKWGLYLQGARLNCGKIVLASLPYPQESFDTMDYPSELCDDNFIQALMKEIPSDRHKYQAGQVTVIGGSETMPGAPALSGLAALKSGCGMLHYFTTKEMMPSLCALFPEAIYHFRNSDTFMTDKDLAEIKSLSDRTNAWLIGPGLGREDSTKQLVLHLLKEFKGPFILDADALFFLNIDNLKNLNKPCILTPHFGEFCRLFNVSHDSLREKPVQTALEYAAKSGCIIHLKSAGSLTAFPDGKTYIHTSGSPGMATAGSGDVLAGITASFCSQGYSPEEAILIAAHIHGKAGEKAAEKKGIHSMIASDIINELPEILKFFQKTSWQISDTMETL